MEVQECQAETGTVMTEAHIAELKELKAELAKYRPLETKAVTEVTACLGGTSTDKDMDLVYELQWAKIGNDVRRQEQAHDATALMHALFVLDARGWNKDDPEFMKHMPRCKNHMTYRRVRRGQFSFENNKGNEVCEVKTFQHSEVCEATLCRSMDGEVCEVTFADTGWKSRHRQKRQLLSLVVDSTQDQGGLMETVTSNHTKNVQSGTKNAEQELRVRDIQLQQQEPEQAMPDEKKHVKTERRVTQAKVEENKRALLLRHLECNTKSEEIELQARVMGLKHGRKHMRSRCKKDETR